MENTKSLDEIDLNSLTKVQPEIDELAALIEDSPDSGNPMPDNTTRVGLIFNPELSVPGSYFDPKRYMTKLRGAEYLSAQARVAWFRSIYPLWTIETECLEETEPETRYRRDPISGKETSYEVPAKVKFVARIKDENGRLVAMAHKIWNSKKLPDFYFEAAETGAINRALAVLGFGTIASGYEFHERRVTEAI